MKHIIHLIIVASCFFSSLLSITESSDNHPHARKTEREHQREYCEAYLKSYSHANLKMETESVLYSSSVPAHSFNRLDNLSDGGVSQTGEVVFDVTYLSLLDKIFITASLIDNLGNDVSSVFISGDAFMNSSTDQPEIRYDYAGDNFLASEYIDPSLIEPIAFGKDNVITLEGNGGEVPITFPVIQITLSVANLDEALPAVANVYAFALLEVDGPIEYMIYQAKLYLIAANYNHNIQNDNPSTYINNQNTGNWDEWDYGFCHLDHNGCEIFAMFNFFISQGQTPHLATLIAVTQLLNADMGFGLLGTNPWPEEYVSLLYTTTLAALTLLSPIIITVVMPIVANIIVVNYITSQSVWNQLYLWPLYPVEVGITTTALNALFIATLAVGNVIYEYHVKYFHGIDEVLRFYGDIDNVQARVTLNSFLGLTDSYGSYIISFWNELIDDTHLPNPFGELHTIFVCKPIQNCSSYTAYNTNEIGPVDKESIDAIIDTESPNLAQYRFISGYAIGS